MAITGVNNNSRSYINNYNDKNSEKNSEISENDKEKSVSKSIKKDTERSYKSVDEYRKYLQDRFHYFGRKSSIDGVPSTVTVSDSFF